MIESRPFTKSVLLFLICTSYIASFSLTEIENKTTSSYLRNWNIFFNKPITTSPIALFTQTLNIKVFSNSVEITNGNTSSFALNNTDYGSTELGTTITRTFTIKNIGTEPLTIIKIALSNNSDFSIVGTPPDNSIPIFGHTTFQIQYNSLSIGFNETTAYVYTSANNRGAFNFKIKAESSSNFFDSDEDGIRDNIDIDDDNDGIEDSIEELTCENSNISMRSNYKFIQESFGTGDRTQINTSHNSETLYCYEDGTASCSTLGGMDLNEGEYTVYSKATNEEFDPLADKYWYTGEDHSPEDIQGRMGLFNAALEPGIFYSTQISGVLPNIALNYSFWILNLDTDTTPEIDSRLRPNIRVEFRDVNDFLLASINTGDIPPSTNEDDVSSWHNFSTELSFPVTEFNVFFYSINIGGLGNDFAIDDITISQKLCDTDGDGVPNSFDLDSDNDGIPDVVESGFGAVSNGKAKIEDWQDNNGNGMHDAFEGILVLDSDSDGTPNFIDLDSDNDTIFDVDESGAGNLANASFINGDGDVDGDGVGDGSDSDAFRKKDFNSDGIPEFFPDGILDIYDYYQGSDLSGSYGNSDQGISFTNFVIDSDSDNLPDYLDTFNNLTNSFDISETLYAHLDNNSDGVIDDTKDTEGDGVLDLFDTDDFIFGSPRNLNDKLQLYFDGRNDYAQDDSIMSNWSEVTMMGWINIDSLNEDTSVLFGQDNFHLRLDSNGKLSLLASGTNITYNTVLPINQWIHIGATYSNSSEELKLFVNGDPVNLVHKSGTLATDNSLFTFGRNALTNSNFFNGYIDEIRIFDKALSEDEYQKIVYQEIEDHDLIKGVEIPLEITSLSWSNLKKYYRFDSYSDNITHNNAASDEENSSGAKLYNLKTIARQTAPMPFVSQQGSLSLPEALTVVSDGINGHDAITYDWSIVRIEHTGISFNNNQRHLGLIINDEDTVNNPIAYTVTNNSELNVSWYLKLDGFIDLEGQSQLIQGIDSKLDTQSKGKIERDQQGTADLFTYNYWSSPVGAINENSNNATYILRSILRDGSDPAIPKPINWINSGFDGANTNPIGIADYWIWKFNTYLNEPYSLWQHVRSNGNLNAGEGFTMKGPGTGSVLDQQNYVFTGKPNNGHISLELYAGNNYLIGNPYPSAIDAYRFICDNGNICNNNNEINTSEHNPPINGSIYFWQHYGGGSHQLLDYNGSYGIYNLSGAVPAASYETNYLGFITGRTPTVLPERYIQVGQGFFVMSKNTGELNFNNEQRIFQKEASLNSGFTRNFDDNESDDPRAKLRLGFKSVNTIQRQLLLTIDPQATSSVDYGFDADVLDDLIDDMYWLIEGDKYTIQAIDNINQSTVLPLGIHVNNPGLNEIMIDSSVNFNEELDIYLHDKHTEKYHDLKATDYSVELAKGTFLNRFEITFEIPDALTIEQENFNNLKFYFAFNRNKIVILNPKGVELKQLDVVNMMGQSVYYFSELYSNAYNEYDIGKLVTGTYIIKLNTASGSLTKKIIIK